MTVLFDGLCGLGWAAPAGVGRFIPGALDPRSGPNGGGAAPRAAHARGSIPGPCHDAVVTLPLVPGTLVLSRNVRAADLFLPQEVALFVAVDEVDHRGWRVARPVKDVSVHTDVPAQRSTVTLSYWDDTPDRTVDGEVDVEVHTIAMQV